MKNVILLGEEDRPAPGDLRFVQGLLNTLDVSKGSDVLGDTAQATDWLRRFGLLAPDTDIAEQDAERLRQFREAVRAVIEHGEDGDSVADAIMAVNTLTAGVALGVSFAPGGSVELHNRSSGIDGAIGTLLVAIAEAHAHGTWQRLKICGRDSCRWAFYDSSRNRSSNWCSMEVCGNREKVARHRHKAAAEEAAVPT